MNHIVNIESKRIYRIIRKSLTDPHANQFRYKSLDQIANNPTQTEKIIEHLRSSESV